MKISDKLFIEKNKQLFKNLVPGKIYSIFENNEIVLYKTPEAETHCQTVQRKDKPPTTANFSPNNNRFITRIAICGQILRNGIVCTRPKAGRIKNTLCKSCQKIRNRKTVRSYYHKNKKVHQPRKQRRVNSIWHEIESKKAVNIAHKITGLYPRVADRHYIGMPRLDTFDEVEKGLCLK